MHDVFHLLSKYKFESFKYTQGSILSFQSEPSCLIKCFSVNDIFVDGDNGVDDLLSFDFDSSFIARPPLVGFGIMRSSR